MKKSITLLQSESMLKKEFAKKEAAMEVQMRQSVGKKTRNMPYRSRETQKTE